MCKVKYRTSRQNPTFPEALAIDLSSSFTELVKLFENNLNFDIITVEVIQYKQDDQLASMSRRPLSSAKSGMNVFSWIL